MEIGKPKKGKRAGYRIEADRTGVHLTVDEQFWDNTPRDEGSTQIDFNIAQVVEEIRAILYFIATDTTGH